MDKLTLFAHKGRCTPLRPCTMCKAVSFLTRKLSEEDFNRFIGIAVGREKYGPDNPVPLDVLLELFFVINYFYHKTASGRLCSRKTTYY